MNRGPLLVPLALLAGLITVTVLVPAAGVFDRRPPRVIERPAQKGTVTRVLRDEPVPLGQGTGRHQIVEVALAGRTVIIDHAWDPSGALPPPVAPGDTVLIGTTPGPEGDIYYLADHARDRPIWALAAAFVLLVLAVGRRQGMWSLLGMAASLLVIVRFIVPGILAGHPPVLISVVGALAILLPTLYLAHGASRKTSVALAGTAVSLSLTAVLASLSIEVARLTGAAEETVALQSLAGGIPPRGLLLAGMIIGALGVLDDVTIGQASTVFELWRANPALGMGELFRRGMNVGRDHIASTVNTLVLAYAGAALPLLILLASQPEPLPVLVNREFLATEIVRTLVGSIGIVAAVPVTTLIAAIVAARTPVPAPVPTDGPHADRDRVVPHR